MEIIYGAKKVFTRSAIYSSLFTNNGSKNSKITRQTDSQKQTVSLHIGQINYIGPN